MKCKNYPKSENTWKPKDNLKNCGILVEDFIKKRFITKNGDFYGNKKFAKRYIQSHNPILGIKTICKNN